MDQEESLPVNNVTKQLTGQNPSRSTVKIYSFDWEECLPVIHNPLNDRHSLVIERVHNPLNDRHTPVIEWVHN